MGTHCSPPSHPRIGASGGNRAPQELPPAKGAQAEPTCTPLAVPKVHPHLSTVTNTQRDAQPELIPCRSSWRRGRRAKVASVRPASTV